MHLTKMRLELTWRAMRQGDSVKIIASGHSDVPVGCAGMIRCALGDGYGVTITAEFFITGVVPFRRFETRTVWFPARHLVEAEPVEENPAESSGPMECSIIPDKLGTQGCVSCDQALIRAGG